MTRFSPARIGTMLLRYVYLLSPSWPRTLDLVYWPRRTHQGFRPKLMYEGPSGVVWLEL